MHASRHEKGFTIIELLVVVAIIGVLTSIGLVILSDAREKGRDARRFEDLQQIKNALELYSADNAGLYPPGTNLAQLVTGQYIAALPPDPVAGASYTYQAMDSAGVACGSSPCSSYVLKAVLEQVSQEALDIDLDGVVGGVNCADPAFCFSP